MVAHQILRLYRKLQQLLSSVSSLSSAYHTIKNCDPPLQLLNPERLYKLVDRIREEVREFRSDLEALQSNEIS